MISIIRWTFVWLGFGGFYLFLAGDVSTVEIIAALACTSLATALAVSITRIAHRRFRLRPTPRAILRPPAACLTEAFAVGRQLIAAIVHGKDRRGGFVRQPFDPGSKDDPAAVGRRALAVLGVSLAPGSFVVRGDRSDTLILHALPEKPPSPDTRWPA